MGQGLLIFFAILGILFSGLLIHEGVHVLQANPLSSICWDINSKSVMHVNGNFDGTENEETLAYFIEISFIIILLVFLLKRFK